MWGENNVRLDAKMTRGMSLSDLTESQTLKEDEGIREEIQIVAKCRDKVMAGKMDPRTD